MTILKFLAGDIFSELSWKNEKNFTMNNRPPIQYYTNHTFSENKLILSGETKIMAESYDDKDLSNIVRDTQLLGPFELQLLKIILFVEKSCVFIVGSAGCGKTSSIRYITDFLLKKQKRKKVPIFNWNLPKGNLLNFRRCFFKNYIYIDFNSISGKFESLSKQGKSPTFLTDEFTEEFFNTLSLKIKTSLEESIRKSKLKVTSDKIYIDIFYVAYLLAHGKIENPKKNEYNPCSIFNRIGKTFKKAFVDLSENEGIDEIISEIDKLESNTKIDLLGSFLEVIELDLNRYNNQLTIILDNIDPLPGFLQLHLKHIFHSSFADKGFKVIIPARLPAYHNSRFRDVFTKYPHSGASPNQIIVDRLIQFLKDPSKFKAYLSLNGTEKYLAICRAIELVLKMSPISNRSISLGQSIIDTCGNSVRRGLLVAKSLYSSSDLPLTYPHFNIIEQNKFFEEILLVTNLREIGTAILSSVESMISILRKRYQSEEDQKRIAIIIFKNIILSISTINLNLKRFIDNNSNLDDLICDMLDGDLGKAIRNDVSHATNLAFGYAKKSLDDNFGIAICKFFINNFKKYVRGTKDQSTDPLLSHRVQNKILEILENGIKIALEKKYDYINIGSIAQGGQSIFEIPSTININTILFKIDSVVDLFHNQNGNIDSCSIRLLYILAYSRGYKSPTNSLIENLLDYGYSQTQILNAFDHLSGKFTRLIYINEQFGYKRWEDLESERDYITMLTKTGKYAFARLLRNPVYIASKSFSRIENYSLKKKETDLTDSLYNALNTLEILFEDEKEHIIYRRDFLKAKNRTRTFYKEKLSVLSASLDITCHSLTPLIKILSTHFKNIKDDNLNKDDKIEKLVYIRNLVQNWIFLVESMITNMYQIYNEKEIPLESTEQMVIMYRIILESEINKGIINSRQLGLNISFYDDQIKKAKKTMEEKTFWYRGMPYDEYIK